MICIVLMMIPVMMISVINIIACMKNAMLNSWCNKTILITIIIVVVAESMWRSPICVQ
jgi:hypothetical protein